VSFMKMPAKKQAKLWCDRLLYLLIIISFIILLCERQGIIGHTMAWFWLCGIFSIDIFMAVFLGWTYRELYFKSYTITETKSPKTFNMLFIIYNLCGFFAFGCMVYFFKKWLIAH